MEITAENAGERLLEFRLDNKLTQINIQERTGLSRKTIRKIESGTGNPQIMTLYKLDKLINGYRK